MILKTYYRNDDDPSVMAGILQEFVLALSGFPDWCVQSAFDTWTRTCFRRPTPGEIVILASRARQPFTEEIARRERIAEQEAEAEAARKRRVIQPEAAQRILEEYGFTAQRIEAFRLRPMSTTFAEAEAPFQGPAPLPVGDWPSALAEDDYRVQALRRARSENEIMRAAGYRPPAPAPEHHAGDP